MTTYARTDTPVNPAAPHAALDKTRSLVVRQPQSGDGLPHPSRAEAVMALSRDRAPCDGLGMRRTLPGSREELAILHGDGPAADHGVTRETSIRSRPGPHDEQRLPCRLGDRPRRMGPSDRLEHREGRRRRVLAKVADDLCLRRFTTDDSQAR